MIPPKAQEQTSPEEQEWAQFNKDMDAQELETLTRAEFEQHYRDMICNLRNLGANKAAEQAMIQFRLLLFYKKGWWPI